MSDLRKKLKEIHAISYNLNDFTDRILALIEQEISSYRAKQEAWYAAFGTTQLTHAVARLDAAEDKVKRLEQDQAEMVEKVEGLKKLFDCATSSGEQRYAIFYNQALTDVVNILKNGGK